MHWKSTGSLVTGTSKLVTKGLTHVSQAVVITNGTNEGSLTLYDGEIHPAKALITVHGHSTPRTTGLEFPKPLTATQGLFAVVTGTGSAAWVIHNGEPA